MSLPILHSFAGYSLYKLTSKKQPKKGRGWRTLAFCVFLANLPDFDFIPGLLLQDATLFHRGISHSLGAAVLVALIAGSIGFLWKKGAFISNFCLVFCVYASHLFLDLCYLSTKGVMLLWPFSTERIYNPLVYFGASLQTSVLDSAGGMSDFLRCLFSPRILSAVCQELAIVLGCIAVYSLMRKSAGRHEVFRVPVNVLRCGLAAVLMALTLSL